MEAEVEAGIEAGIEAETEVVLGKLFLEMISQ